MGMLTVSKRGGLGVRHARADRQQQASGYRLVGVPSGSPVAECLDPYRRWQYGYRTGVIVRNSTAMVTVQWDGEESFTTYSAGDARYKVDTNLWRIGESRSKSPLTALTSPAGEDRFTSSPHPGAPTTTGGSAMADDTTTYTVEEIDAMMLPALRKLAAEHYEADDLKGLKKAQLQTLLKENPAIIASDDVDEDEVDDEELDDEVEDEDEEDDTPETESDDELDDIEVDEDEEVDEPVPAPKKSRAKAADKPAPAKATKAKADTPPEPTGDTLTAKQVATRIGTDAKTLRKFFRSDASTVEAVGQGGRYEFAKEDLETIRSEFNAWNTSRPTRSAPGAKADKPAEPKRKAAEEVPDEELELEDDEEASGPSDDELDDLELEDDELDDDELDD